MSKTKVAAEPILRTWDQVKSQFKELAQLDLHIQNISNKQTKQINAIKEKYSIEAEPFISRKIRLEKDIQEFCEFYKEQFDKEKSKDLGFGKIGFRRSSRLTTMSKWTWAKVLAKLKEIKRLEFIRIKEEVNKDAIKAANLKEDILNSFGCTIKIEDKFWYEIDQKAIAEAPYELELHRKAS